MTSTVSEARGAYGSWRIDWRGDTPASIREAANARNFPFAAVRFYDAPVGADAVGTVPGLFTGLLTRSDLGGAGGVSPTWLVGSPGGSIWEPRNESGPYDDDPAGLALDGNSAGTLSDWVNYMVYFTESGLSTGIRGGNPTQKNGGTIAARTLRTFLDTFIVPVWNVEWRVTDRFALDVGYTAELYPLDLATMPLAVKGGRRTPGNAALDVASFGLETDYSDYITRYSVRGGFDQIWSVGVPPVMSPTGVALNWGTIVEGGAMPAADANSKAYLGFAHSGRRSAVDLEVTDRQLTTRVVCGGYVGVWDLDGGFWDLTQTVRHGGQDIHPVVLRVEGVDWPVTADVGVWLDRRHITSVPADQRLIDLTPYVEPASADATTKLTVGAPPRAIGVAGRR